MPNAMIDDTLWSWPGPISVRTGNALKRAGLTLADAPFFASNLLKIEGIGARTIEEIGLAGLLLPEESGPTAHEIKALITRITTAEILLRRCDQLLQDCEGVLRHIHGRAL